MLGRVPSGLTDVGLVAGYWFWELDRVPDAHQYAIGLVDEIWAPTRFVRDAYLDATTKPVRLAPLPIAEPALHEAAVPVSVPGVDLDDFVFVVSFDHASVMERKNPIGAIEAFGDAFDADDRSVKLVVKTINGDQHPDAMRRLRHAAGDDSRIVVWDEGIDRAAMMAVIARADAFVTLHRSEGLGLHPADAMWLGTPVISTRWSGTLDLMDHDSAMLIDAVLVPVGDIGHGSDAYPSDAFWADPDREQATTAMRRLRHDAEFGRSLAEAARRRMERQPPRASAGRSIAAAASGWGVPESAGSIGSPSSEPASVA
jgi:glycosyltransferase involved in cell wall biosynthesis